MHAHSGSSCGRNQPGQDKLHVQDSCASCNRRTCVSVCAAAPLCHTRDAMGAGTCQRSQRHTARLGHVQCAMQLAVTASCISAEAAAVLQTNHKTCPWCQLADSSWWPEANCGMLQRRQAKSACCGASVFVHPLCNANAQRQAPHCCVYV
jgi:hypothetical protein